MRVMSVIACTFALAACSPSIAPVTPGADGYDAIEFLRATQIRDHSINTYTFDAGSRFVGDRYDDNGGTLYCGLASINADGRPFNVCLGFEEPSTIIIGPGASFKEVRRVQPSGTIRHVKFAP